MLESPFPSVLLISRSLPRCHNTHLHLSLFILSIFASSLFPVSLSCITNIPPLFWPSLVLPGLEDLGLSLSAATLPGLNSDNGVLCLRTQVQRLNRDYYFKRVQLVSLRQRQDS